MRKIKISETERNSHIKSKDKTDNDKKLKIQTLNKEKPFYLKKKFIINKPFVFTNTNTRYIFKHASTISSHAFQNNINIYIS